MTIELDSTLAQAEVLFLSFSQLIADIDRRAAEEASSQVTTLRQRRSGSISGSSSNAQAQPKPKRPIISEELRELLHAGQ